MSNNNSDSESFPGDNTGNENNDSQAADDNKESGDGFDAVGAAAELDAALAAEPAEPEGEPQGESYEEILESEVESLNALVAEKDKALAEAEDELAQSNARIEREAQKQLEQRTRKLLLGFIEVLDDLERALAAAREVDHNPAVVDGIELVHKRFLAKLTSFGVTHEPALGARFDPNVHDAVSMVPSQEPAQDGTVVAVVREGYLIKGETLRPAGVVVAKSS